MASGPFEDLLERRVPQYVAVYLGAAWVAVEFFAFLEDRFLLSPHLTNLVMALLLLMLPSVVLFTYHHGRPGADRWQKIEKAVIPANLLVAVVLLSAGFAGKDLGAITTTVSAEDEEGNVVERVIPKSEYRKRLAIFPPAAPADSSWLGQAVTHALHMDLYQDMFLDVRVPAHYLERLRERGLADALSVPRALEREIARDLQLDHFVDGDVGPAPEGYRLRIALHATGRGDEVPGQEFRGPDLLALVDSASTAIRRGLELPTAHLAENPDLPVAEMTTASLDAFREYVLGVMDVVYTVDYDAATAHLERAVELDPAYAMALFSLYQVRFLNGDRAGAGAALAATMDHLYRLPERVQSAVKAEHYGFHQDLDRYAAVHEMRTELYPQDIDAHLAVAQIREIRDDLPGVIDALVEVLALDPTRVEALHRLGELHQRTGDPEAAEGYFQRFVDRVPERPDGYLSLGRLHLAAGEHAAARERYERALLIEPQNVEVLVALAELARVTGGWEEAEHRLQEAVGSARTAQGREAAYREARRYRVYRGDYDRAVADQERAVAASWEYLPPMVAVQLEIVGLGDYVRAGRAAEARSRLDSLGARLPSPADILVIPIGRAELWLALEEPDSARAAVIEAEEAIAATGYDALTRRVVYDRGRVHELRGEWDRALDAYRRERELAPADPVVPSHLGRVYRELGQLDRAESRLLETLEVWPSHARANYDLGRVYLDMDRPEDAVRHLERAVDAWSLADPGHARADSARARLEEARLRLRPRRPRG